MSTSELDMHSPLGNLKIIEKNGRICELNFAKHKNSQLKNSHPVLMRAKKQLEEYFAGTRKSFDLPLSPDGTAFQKLSWQTLREIPFGRSWSYAEQAAKMGDRRKARAVGQANGRNPIPIIIPCHRVIGASGHLTGYSAGMPIKRWLLAHEGIKSLNG